MKIMGLDVGDKTIGVAISDETQLIANGKETIFRTNISEDIGRIITWIREENVSKIVVGLPKNMNGTLGSQAEKTMSFVKKLQKKILYTDRLENREIEIIYWDERLTSVAAEKMLITGDVRREKRKLVIDKLAAVLILQGYLDSLKK